ncbi:MAG: MBL fold metallo-hydrolase [Bacteroidales bacterium]|nr:MBL fold metallo-hydrolase [Bacteroidales bacterium]
MLLRRFIVNRLEENCWVASADGKGCVVVDPGQDGASETEALKEFFSSSGLKPEAVLITHGHMDHVYGVAAIQREYGTPVYMSPLDIPTLDYFDSVKKLGIHVPDRDFSITAAEEGSIVEAGGLRFRAIATPGHSPGGLCWIDDGAGIMFTGDTLFAGTIGRTDLVYGDYDSLIKSIMDKLMGLPGETEIYPGHGPSGTIAGERTGNPFLEPFNEKEESDYLYD